MMRALVVFALAAAAADVTVGTDDEPTAVKTATKLRAALTQIYGSSGHGARI